MVNISLGAFFIGYYLAVYNMSWNKAKMIYGIEENEAFMKGNFFFFFVKNSKLITINLIKGIN